MKMQLTWAHFAELCSDLVKRVQHPENVTGVYGVPNGGIYVAIRIATLLNVPILSTPSTGCIVVDDVVDTGALLMEHHRAGYECHALVRKPAGPDFGIKGVPVHEEWVVFPWELMRSETAPVDAVKRLRQFYEANPQEPFNAYVEEIAANLAPPPAGQ